ncbi:MAG: SBBP repeat-containing protein, partial [Bryobacteraceae bacterium]
MKFTIRLALATGAAVFCLQATNLSLSQIPVGFEQNSDARTFAVKGLRYQAATSPQGFTVVLPEQDGENRTVRMSILNGNAKAEPRPIEKLNLRTSYLVGKRSEWRTAVSTFKKVRYQGVLPSIDIEYRPAGEQLEFDFILQPGAEPHDIALHYEGQDGMLIDEQGSLVVIAGQTRMVQAIPAIYQRAGASVHLVSGEYVIDSRGDVRFHLGPYDRAQPLVIDPVIVYSGFIAANGGTVATSFGRDPQGFWYVAGTSGAGNLPVAGNANQNARNGDIDGFVMKINPTLSGGPRVTDLAYFGGAGADEIRAMAVGPTGILYITGVTASSNLPVSDDASQLTIGGARDAFFAKIDFSLLANLSLLHCTYLGGTLLDVGTAIAVDSAGNAYLTGYTASLNFAVGGTPYQSTPPNGWNAFVTVFNNANAITYSTYLGGNGTDSGRAIAVASDGNIIVAGTTLSTNFPIAGSAVQATYNGGGDAFVSKLSVASGLIYSTYLGGTGPEDLKAIALNAAGQVVVTGWTLSQDYPIAGAYQPTLRGGTDAFVTVLDLTQPAATGVVYSTLYGGGDSEVPSSISLDPTGRILIAGYTYSATDLPVTADAFQATLGGGVDSFIARFDPTKQGNDSLTYATYL